MSGATPNTTVQSDAPLTRLPFPPLTRTHVINCSVPCWHERYRAITPKTRLVPLSDAFLKWLGADGIVLPPDDYPKPKRDSEWDDDAEDWNDAEEVEDPSKDWADVHKAIQSTIEELDGSVFPKLNWSAPKDATWIAPANSMECRNANDVYLLLKSSDFITHDLEHAFDGCESDPSTKTVSYTLVLRKTVPALISSMEFRCFVRNRKVIGVCQRDLNHYDFMASLVPTLRDLILDFFEEKLGSFPDDNFVFDVYIPDPKPSGRVWLIDINPWAVYTDALLFSWLELLTMPEESASTSALQNGVLRLSIRSQTGGLPTPPETEDEEEADEEIEDVDEFPEIRLIKRDDPEAYSFNSPLYGAHKLPKEVVDASQNIDGQGGMREFMTDWRERVRQAEERARQDDDSDDSD